MDQLRFKKNTNGNRLTSNRGFALVWVLIAGAIVSLVSVTMARLFLIQNKNMRTVAAKGGVNDLSTAVDLLLNSSNCRSLGVSNFTYNGQSPVQVSIVGGSYSLSADTLRFSNGVVAITSLPSPEMASMIRPFKIEGDDDAPGIAFLPLGGEGPIAGGFQYPFQIKISFSNPSGLFPGPLSKFAMVYTDASQNVVGICGRKDNASNVLLGKYFNFPAGVSITSGATPAKFHTVSSYSIDVPSSISQVMITNSLAQNCLVQDDKGPGSCQFRYRYVLDGTIVSPVFYTSTWIVNETRNNTLTYFFDSVVPGPHTLELQLCVGVRTSGGFIMNSAATDQILQFSSTVIVGYP